MTSTATHLRTVILHWPDLRDALAAPALVGAFGLGLRGYLAQQRDDAAEEYERAHAAHLRSLERDPIQLGERPAPVRIPVLDTMREVEEILIEQADVVASAVQRPPMPRAPETWPAADRARRDQLARADQLDPRRWTWTGTRTAQYAALWLLARVEQRPGPFAALTEAQLDEVARTARACAARVERALDISNERRALERRCACGGRIDVHGGAGRAPLAHCTGCGRIWTESGQAA
ncbi:hypothetical protein STTU_4925 [Streptomyces sp. Tu6071]|uniref:hypothetical protein n=1 Tax=Streptomyces sp. Tu6071 TaxID=355249 RepID=UPI00020E6001|nr:hypothetical protein [Streptomyces sp. Tu6071]EGJ77714.1 hypothetical protein STTU_4925 [Streptomyces sp. Tu6071]